MTKVNSICLAIALALCTGSSQAVPNPKMSTPTITCGGNPAASYINITVMAGITGAPAGFTVQWETAADFATYGWSELAPSYCGGSFSGNASDSSYNLAPNQSITVQIGDNIFDDPGASSSCPGTSLNCGTEYVFRAFAHASSTLKRSDFTSTLHCSTLPCIGGGCTYTQGYWKTHGPEGCVTGNNTNQWQATSLSLGTVSYTDLQLCSIFQTPAKGNGLIALAHQLIAAKLNIAAGADSTDAAAAVAAADALIGSLVVPPVGVGSLDPSVTSALTGTLSSYNEGLTGPGHCVDELPQP